MTQNLELVTERRGLVTGGSYVDTLTLQNAAEDHNLLSTCATAADVYQQFCVQLQL